MKMMFTAARAASMMVTISRTWFSRAVWEMNPTSDRPGLAAAAAFPDTSRVAWANRIATIPLTVTAMLRLPSRTRRGLRAASRTASSSGTGRRAEYVVGGGGGRGGGGARGGGGGEGG